MCDDLPVCSLSRREVFRPAIKPLGSAGARPSPCAMVSFALPGRLGFVPAALEVIRLTIKPLGPWRTASLPAALPPPPRRSQRPVAFRLCPHRSAFPRSFLMVVHGSTPRRLVDRTARRPAPSQEFDCPVGDNPVQGRALITAPTPLTGKESACRPISVCD